MKLLFGLSYLFFLFSGINSKLNETNGETLKLDLSFLLSNDTSVERSGNYTQILNQTSSGNYDIVSLNSNYTQILYRPSNSSQTFVQNIIYLGSSFTNNTLESLMNPLDIPPGADMTPGGDMIVTTNNVIDSGNYTINYMANSVEIIYNSTSYSISYSQVIQIIYTNNTNTTTNTTTTNTTTTNTTTHPIRNNPCHHPYPILDGIRFLIHELNDHHHTNMSFDFPDNNETHCILESGCHDGENIIQRIFNLSHHHHHHNETEEYNNVTHFNHDRISKVTDTISTVIRILKAAFTAFTVINEHTHFFQPTEPPREHEQHPDHNNHQHQHHHHHNNHHIIQNGFIPDPPRGIVNHTVTIDPHSLFESSFSFIREIHRDS